MFFKILATLVLAASPSVATVFITSPTASTTFHGGQNATINWQDDGNPPTLQTFGNAKVSIYVGNAQQQTSLQTIVESVNVATTSSIQFVPDPNIGPNSPQYFIRVESLSLKDPANPQFPALAFSGKFPMDNMSGQFSPQVQAEIDGQSSAPIAPPTSTSAAASTNQASSASTTSPTSSNKSASASASAKSASSTSNSALHPKAGWAGVILSMLVGVAAF